MEPDAESPGETQGRLQEAHGGGLPEPGAVHVQALRGPDLRLPRLHHQQRLLRGQGHPLLNKVIETFATPETLKTVFYFVDKKEASGSSLT